MPQYTTNYNLKKPEGTDNYNIQDHNDNMDLIDQELKQNSDTTAAKETPAGAQAKVDTHAAVTSAHNATSTATASRIMIRDANGRAKVAAPSAVDDIARKDTVDAVQTNLNTHLADIVTVATANKILKLNSSAKLPASITGDADTVDSLHASSFLQIAGTPNTAGYWDTSVTAPTGTTRLNYSGYLYATRVYNAVYNDYAEFFKKDEDFEPGDVVTINPDGDGYIKSREAYSPLVVGVVSDEYAHCIGAPGGLTPEEVEESYSAIALSGRVSVKVTGNVNKGDLLVSSHLPGVAMAMNEYTPGTVIGKAQDDYFGEGIGRARMLVMLS